MVKAWNTHESPVFQFMCSLALPFTSIADNGKLSGTLTFPLLLSGLRNQVTYSLNKFQSTSAHGLFSDGDQTLVMESGDRPSCHGHRAQLCVPSFCG